MIVVKENLLLVQRAQRDHSYTGSIKYHLAARISTLAIALLLLAEAVARAGAACLAGLSLLASLCLWRTGGFWMHRQMQKSQIAFSISLQCFLSVFLPKSLQDRLIASPLGGIVREHRLRSGARLIQRKLQTELEFAEAQKDKELDGPDFQYLKGRVGSIEKEQIGPCEVATCHFIGRRPTMEDQHLATSFNLNIQGKNYPVLLFGIFDGHGGPKTAIYLKKYLRERLEKTLLEFNSERLTDEGIWNALKMTCVRLNEELKNEKSGSTATMTMVLDGRIWTANVGDSRTILCSGNQVTQLSEDANPSDERYEKTIKNRRGWVEWVAGVARVNKVIAVARAFGDHSPEMGDAMSARPKITCVPLPDKECTLVLACDGVYDVASTKQVGGAVCAHPGEAPEVSTQRIVFSAYKANSTDNLSAMVVRFHHPTHPQAVKLD